MAKWFFVLYTAGYLRFRLNTIFNILKNVLSYSCIFFNIISLLCTDTRLTSKELPTTKWRRDRRIRMSSEYHSPGSPNVKPLSESNSTNSSNGSGSSSASNCSNGNGFSNVSATAMVIETPLDMSVSSKPRTPPPPYREPLPGSTFANTLARPSVITQAPKREILSGNQENKDTIPVMAVGKFPHYEPSTKISLTLFHHTESISMIDPVIDEHFRRSLGADYMTLFGNKKSSSSALTIKPTAARKAITTTTGAVLTAPVSPAPIPTSPPPPTVAAAAIQSPSTSPLPSPPVVAVARVSSPPAAISSPNSAAAVVVVAPSVTTDDEEDLNVAMSVDDHFAKALGGDTWKQLQRSDSSKNDDASRHCVKH